MNLKMKLSVKVNSDSPYRLQTKISKKEDNCLKPKT